MWFLLNNLPPGYQHHGSVFLVDPPLICNGIVAVLPPPLCEVGDTDKDVPIVVPQTAILEKPKDLLLVITVERLDMLTVSAPHHV